MLVYYAVCKKGLVSQSHCTYHRACEFYIVTYLLPCFLLALKNIVYC